MLQFRPDVRSKATPGLWELLKSQGMQENQQVVFLSDGGDSVRNLQAYLHPDSEHWLDWFHITMRITLLQQQVKTLKDCCRCRAWRVFRTKPWP
jgi:hypothetical protein